MIHLALVGPLLVLQTVAPLSVEQCVEASTSGQAHQKRSELFQARRDFEACADSSCPALVQAECTKWLAEVLAATPSIVLVVRVGGVDVRPQEVRLDGQPWLTELSGKPEALEPGAHELLVTVEGRTQALRLVVNVAEKNRLVVFELERAPPVSLVTPAWRPLPALAIATSAVAAVTFGVFVGLGVSTRSRLDALLASPCAATKTCSPSTVADLQRRFAVADVSLAVSLVAAAVAGWQWYRFFSAPSPVTLAPMGNGVSIVGQF